MMPPGSLHALRKAKEHRRVLLKDIRVLVALPRSGAPGRLCSGFCRITWWT